MIRLPGLNQYAIEKELRDSEPTKDIPVVMLSNWQQAQPEMLAKRPNLRRLVEQVAARPAVKRVLVQNELAA